MCLRASCAADSEVPQRARYQPDSDSNRHGAPVHHDLSHESENRAAARKSCRDILGCPSFVLDRLQNIPCPSPTQSTCLFTDGNEASVCPEGIDQSDSDRHGAPVHDDLSHESDQPEMARC